jgi:hypothetical protein
MADEPRRALHRRERQHMPTGPDVMPGRVDALGRLNRPARGMWAIVIKSQLSHDALAMMAGQPVPR